MAKPELYSWYTASTSFLTRAKAGLEAFDRDRDVQSLIVSALMLRLGIEARLFEYIYAELPNETRDEDVARIADYTATKLLSRLAGLNPRSHVGTTLVFTPEQGGAPFGFKYTPVTKSLASIHGQIGGLLHMNFFRKNSYWLLPHRGAGSDKKYVLDARDLVAQGISELAEATSGTLLAHPDFAPLVNQLRSEAADANTELSDKVV